MSKPDRSTTPLVIAMLAIFVAAICSFAGRAFYTVSESDLTRLSDDIGDAKALVNQADTESNELTPEHANELRSKVERLSERLTDLNARGPSSSEARMLETIALAAMVVSIIGNGVYIYRKATQQMRGTIE